MRQRTSDRLMARLRALGVDLPENAVLKPLRASQADRKNGAWSWCACDADGVPLPVGGYDTMAQTLAWDELEAHRDEQGDITIDQRP